MAWILAATVGRKPGQEVSNMSPLDGIAVAQSPGWSGWWIVAGIAGVIVLVILLVIAQFFRLWL